MWYLNARKAMCSACQLRTGKMNKRLFSRARRNQPQFYSKRVVRHCTYCWSGNTHSESQCIAKPTCNASLGGGCQGRYSLLWRTSTSVQPCSKLSGKPTPAHGHTSKEKAGNSAAFISHKQRNLITPSNFLRIDCSRSLEQNYLDVLSKPLGWDWTQRELCSLMSSYLL